MDESFVRLKDNTKAIEKVIEETGDGGWRDICTVIEMTLSEMMPCTRRKVWNFLSYARKRMGNKLFEDMDDYADFAIKYRNKDIWDQIIK